MNTLLRLLAYGFIIIGIWLTIIVFIEADFKNVYPTRSFEEAGPFGDYIGGVIGSVFSIAGIFLLFLNFYEQRRTFERERLETQYYERIKTYKENLYELSFTKRKKPSVSFIDLLLHRSGEKETTTHTGRKVFKIIYHDFINLYDEIDFLFSNRTINDIYLSDYLKWLEKNPVIKSRQVDLIELAKIDITYSIIFTGLGSEERHTLISIFSKRYKKTFTTKILAFAALKPVEHSDFYQNWLKIMNNPNFKNKEFGKIYSTYALDNVLTKEGHLDFFLELCQYLVPKFNPNINKNNYYKYYGGHQFRLGHYFRHLFNSIKFIDQNKKLTFSEKQSYIITLRSQLSTYEQIIFFFNSLSNYGRIWEYEDESEKEFVKFQKRLITKYNLIRNISTINLAGSIDVHKYYPNVLFESRYRSEDKAERKKLERIYKYPILAKFHDKTFR